MRVVQLGCGITGLVCVEHLSRNDAIDEIVLADFRTEPAQSLVSRLKSDKFSVVKVDAKDPKAVKRVLSGSDLLISSIPSELNTKVMEQALSVGTDYIDYSVTQEAIDDFDKVSKMCEDAGVTAVTGMGADPGISDIFARYAANKLDSAYEAHVRDGDNGSAEGHNFFTLWSPLDMMEEVTIPAAVFKDGKITFLPPLHKKEIYDFPEPIGPLPVYNTTHEETYLIPKFIKGIRNADFKIAIDDNFVEIANMIRKLGMHSLKPIDVKGVQIRPLDVVVALMPTPVDLIGKVKGSAGVVVEVLGEKGGRKAMVKVWTTLAHERAYQMCGSNATGYLVGTGGAVGADMIVAGEIKGKGLFAPEMLPAEKYVARLPGKNLEVKEQLKYL
jgi:saccharopine dehydrogenase (NAD+, L-lysine-forming)